MMRRTARIPQSKESIQVSNEHSDNEDDGAVGVDEMKSSTPAQGRVNGDQETRRSSSHKRTFIYNDAADTFHHNFKYDQDTTCSWEYSQFPQPTTRDISNWESLTADAKDQCLKAVVRLFLTKGAKGDIVDSALVLATIKQIDANYAKCKNFVLYTAQKELYENFGYIVTSTRAIIGNIDTKKDEYMMVNALQNEALQRILSEKDTQSNAYRGFVFMVSQIIFSSAGRTLDGNSLLRQLRMIDARFPETLTKKKASSKFDGIAVSELGDDLPGLLNRMKKEGYIATSKEDNTVDDVGKVKYTLGPRFHSEIGKKQTLKAHYQSKGEMPLSSLLTMIEEEDAVFIATLKESMGKSGPDSAPPEATVPPNSDRRTRDGTSRSTEPNTSAEKKRRMS